MVLTQREGAKCKILMETSPAIIILCISMVQQVKHRDEEITIDQTVPWRLAGQSKVELLQS